MGREGGDAAGGAPEVNAIEERSDAHAADGGAVRVGRSADVAGKRREGCGDALAGSHGFKLAHVHARAHTGKQIDRRLQTSAVMHARARMLARARAARM
jgi:hypothetical protein